MMDQTRTISRGLTALALVGVMALAACDFEVTNPGPVQDGNLNDAGAHQGIVNGGIRAVQSGVGAYGLLGGAITHDLMASGHTGSAGVRPEEEVAKLSDEYDGRGSWGGLHRGRWINQEALRRFASEEAGVTNLSSYKPAAEANFWAGIALRTLMENACSTVIDGGAPSGKLDYAPLAIAHFTAANSIAAAAGDAALATAAIGARAAAKLYSGDHAGAKTDAATVALSFKYTTKYSGDTGSGEYWYLPGHVASLGFQSMSAWGTPAQTHFLKTGDSRVAWGYDNGSREKQSDGSAAVRGQTHPPRPTWTLMIPMFYHLKTYAPRTAAGGDELRFFKPVQGDQRKIQLNLVTGREMALVQAEAELKAGNLAAAMTLINSVRTATDIYAADLSDASVLDLTYHAAEGNDNACATCPDYMSTITRFDGSAGGKMPAVSAADITAGWTALKFERYLELNLEGRRFGDRWRWRENSTPGTLDALEMIPAELVARYSVPADPLNLCFPLPKAENDANANIPEGYKDWIG
ncbi:MAG: hypothetical protein CME30_01400 [Gemmatimonadetes bacterium]|nr:hypothetical protein [Gemmatimonadota bacterium]